MREPNTPDALTSLTIFVLVSQKSYLEERALLEGLAARERIPTPTDPRRSAA